MKKLLYIIAIGLMFITQACYEDYKFDYDYSATYFAKQYPLRSLIVEEGKDLSFEIGVVLAGKYENNVNEKVNFRVEPDLLDTLAADYPSVKILPDNYYELSDDNEFVIPAGEVNGNITVTLNKDLFLKDALAHEVTYALPLLITESTTDSILNGKNYTIVVIRYFNAFHGSYWLRGVDYTMDVSGNYTNQVAYRDVDLVKNRDLLLTTVGENEILSSYIGLNSSGSSANYSMKIGVRDDGVCTVDGVDMSDLSSLIGAGRYNEEDKVFTLDYSYVDAGGLMHDVFDTLYYRNTEMYVEYWRE